MKAAFRAHEAADVGRELAVQEFITRNLSAEQRKKSEMMLHGLIDQWGPVVSAYPSWHPLVTSSPRKGNSRGIHPQIRPNEKTGYAGLDHTIFLKNAFITCPYGGDETILKSVKELEATSCARIEAEVLGFKLYHEKATPVLVTCEWDEEMEADGTIPKKLAVPLMLEQELPSWRWAQVAESWETMRPYILGSPQGSRSSLFVNQDTGQTLKTIYTALIDTGMYGPVYQES